MIDLIVKINLRGKTFAFANSSTKFAIHKEGAMPHSNRNVLYRVSP